jgi:hypothetical protein
MENNRISAFQATQSVCAVLRNHDFQHFEGSHGNKACTWAKALSCGSTLEIRVFENYIDLLDDNEAISFSATVCIAKTLKVEVVKHDLQYCDFNARLANLLTLSEKLTQNFCSGQKDLTERNDDERLAG